MKKLFLLFALILLDLTVSSNSQTQVFTASDTNITVYSGDQFDISLESNKTTGYSWSVSQVSAAPNVFVLGSEYASANSGKVGEGGQELWHFKANAAGSAKLVFYYMRQWEKEQPVKTVTFNVKIK